MDNDAVIFSARFGGNSQNLYIPMHAVKGIFARESGQGMFFEVGQAALDENTPKESDETPESKQKVTNIKKPTLTIVK
jgi:stringent starvation protein B